MISRAVYELMTDQRAKDQNERAGFVSGRWPYHIVADEWKKQVDCSITIIHKISLVGVDWQSK